MAFTTLLSLLGMLFPASVLNLQLSAQRVFSDHFKLGSLTLTTHYSVLPLFSSFIIVITIYN